MAKKNTSFYKDVSRFVARSKFALNATLIQIKIEFFGSIRIDTPVDTALARTNWQCSIEVPEFGVIEVPYSGITPQSPLTGVEYSDIVNNTGGFGVVAYQSNPISYAPYLEYDGISTQAPAGMMRKNIARLSQIVRKAIEENKLK